MRKMSADEENEQGERRQSRMGKMNADEKGKSKAERRRQPLMDAAEGKEI
jgi:hypothetical protein